MAATRHREQVYTFHRATIDTGIMYRRHRVAALSLRPARWDKGANLRKLEAAVREAARRKPELIVAPENVLDGYVINDVIRHRDRAEALLNIAEPVDGPSMRRLCRLARSLRVCLCVGFARRDGDEVYNSAAFIAHDGTICGIHDKVLDGTHPEWWFRRQGSRVRAFDTPLGRCGVLICSDRWSPLLARTLVLDGAEFLLIPSYGNVNKMQNKAVLARARENGVPVVEANVGMNLIVSRGEIAAYQWGADRITHGWIDIPVAPSPAALEACDEALQRFQKQLQQDWYKANRPAMDSGSPSPETAKPLVPERTFRRLRESRWGTS